MWETIFIALLKLLDIILDRVKENKAAKEAFLIFMNNATDNLLSSATLTTDDINQVNDLKNKLQELNKK